MFAENTDLRDSRSLTCDGRIVLPCSATEGEYVFRKCDLMRKGRTEFCSMLKGANLQTIEDTGELALPPTTDSDGTVKGAAKIAQVGQDAMEKILDSVLTGVTMDMRSALVLWELQAGWGNLFDAFLAKKQSWNFPSYYVTQTDDRMQYEWLMSTKLEATKLAHLAARVDIPGFLPIPETMPTASLEESPVPPSLPWPQ